MCLPPSICVSLACGADLSVSLACRRGLCLCLRLCRRVLPLSTFLSLSSPLLLTHRSRRPHSLQAPGSITDTSDDGQQPCFAPTEVYILSDLCVCVCVCARGARACAGACMHNAIPLSQPQPRPAVHRRASRPLCGVAQEAGSGDELSDNGDEFGEVAGEDLRNLGDLPQAPAGMWPRARCRDRSR